MSWIFTFFFVTFGKFAVQIHIRSFQDALPNSDKYKANRNVVVGVVQTLCGMWNGTIRTFFEP